MAETLLWTYQDAVEAVLDSFDALASGRTLRLAKRAVQEAYRRLPTLHRWATYDATYKFATVATYTTGTIAYDHTGGASERMVTLTTGTWPTWADFGTIKISDVHYQVATRESSSIITLSPNSNPGADVASGTSYTLYRRSYPLPVDFRKHVSLTRDDDQQFVMYCTSEDQFDFSALTDDISDPLTFTIRQDNEYYGGLAIVFSEIPNTDDSYTMLYERSARPLVYYKVTGGTVSVTANATTVTGSGTAFAAGHVGSIIRFSGDGTSAPTPIHGDIAGVDNPYVSQRVITARSSTTSLTIDSAASSANLSAVLYTISDPLDIEHTAMLHGLLRLAESEYARYARMSQKDVTEREQSAFRAIREAAAADYRTREQFYAFGGAGGDYPEVARISVSTDTEE